MSVRSVSLDGCDSAVCVVFCIVAFGVVFKSPIILLTEDSLQIEGGDRT